MNLIEAIKSGSWIQRLSRYLPSYVVYYCAIRVWAEATTGAYSDSDVVAITASEAISRYGRIHGLPGHGKDEHYDSNRATKLGLGEAP